MEIIKQIAEKNQQKARSIIKDLKILEAWESVGAKVNLVGSLKMGLLMKHRDIDFHIYTPSLNISDSFKAMALLAENPAVTHIEYTNLLGTEEECLEWHAWCKDNDGEIWQIDMIQILIGSKYDGYFEKMAERISAVITDEQRSTILKLKYETPDSEKIFGIKYYLAVIRDGINNYDDFTKWLEDYSSSAIIEWIP